MRGWNILFLSTLSTPKQTETAVRRLTDNMRRAWVEKGYILLKGALTRDQVAGYLAATDEVVAKYRETHPEAREQDASTSSRQSSGPRILTR